jgi:ATP-dependent Clp protease protease subunit
MILAENTGKSIDEAAIATERDNYMTAEEAMNFGLIDKIIDRR